MDHPHEGPEHGGAVVLEADPRDEQHHEPAVHVTEGHLVELIAEDQVHGVAEVQHLD